MRRSRSIKELGTGPEMTGMDTLENAQRRAEYWKAEHNAANAEIERLRKATAKYIEQADRVGSIGWRPYDEFRAEVTVPNDQAKGPGGFSPGPA